jgi:hypothetical protein
VRVSGHAQAACLVYLVQVLAEHVVADAVPPFDRLSRADAERQPVPGLGGDLLPQDHQQVAAGEFTPLAVPGHRDSINRARQPEPATAAASRGAHG